MTTGRLNDIIIKFRKGTFATKESMDSYMYLMPVFLVATLALVFFASFYTEHSSEADAIQNPPELTPVKVKRSQSTTPESKEGNGGGAASGQQDPIIGIKNTGGSSAQNIWLQIVMPDTKRHVPLRDDTLAPGEIKNTGLSWKDGSKIRLMGRYHDVNDNSYDIQTKFEMKP